MIYCSRSLNALEWANAFIWPNLLSFVLCHHKNNEYATNKKIVEKSNLGQILA